MLTTEMLLKTYRAGLFPMAINRRGTVAWFSPDPRGILPLNDRFRIPHGLRRALKKNLFAITIDTEFEAVIRACSKSHGDTWISPEILRSYCRLHDQGHAHSVEARLLGELVGGLYGVHIGGAFFGESMFHSVSDASKVALVNLVERLRAQGFTLLDIQWVTPHLAQFGALQIPRAEYLQLLGAALERPCHF